MSSLVNDDKKSKLVMSLSLVGVECIIVLLLVLNFCTINLVGNNDVGNIFVSWASS